MVIHRSTHSKNRTSCTLVALQYTHITWDHPLTLTLSISNIALLLHFLFIRNLKISTKIKQHFSSACIIMSFLSTKSAY